MEGERVEIRASKFAGPYIWGFSFLFFSLRVYASAYFHKDKTLRIQQSPATNSPPPYLSSPLENLEFTVHKISSLLIVIFKMALIIHPALPLHSHKNHSNLFAYSRGKRIKPNLSLSPFRSAFYLHNYSSLHTKNSPIFIFSPITTQACAFMKQETLPVS